MGRKEVSERCLGVEVGDFFGCLKLEPNEQNIRVWEIWEIVTDQYDSYHKSKLKACLSLLSNASNLNKFIYW